MPSILFTTHSHRMPRLKNWQWTAIDRITSSNAQDRPAASLLLSIPRISPGGSVAALYVAVTDCSRIIVLSGR